MCSIYFITIISPLQKNIFFSRKEIILVLVMRKKYIALDKILAECLKNDEMEEICNFNDEVEKEARDI